MTAPGKREHLQANGRTQARPRACLWDGNTQDEIVGAKLDDSAWGFANESEGIRRDVTPGQACLPPTLTSCITSTMAEYGYRHYAPELGRWVNRDPIGEKGGVNLYGYVRNHSIDGFDYLGLNVPPLPSFDWKAYFEGRFPAMLAGVRAQYQSDVDSWVQKHCGQSPYPNPTRRFSVLPSLTATSSAGSALPEYDPSSSPKGAHKATISDDHYGDPSESYLEAYGPGELGSFVLDIAAPVTISYSDADIGGNNCSQYKTYSWATSLYLEDMTGEEAVGLTESAVKLATWSISGSGKCVK